ncbi:hypothetical protein BO71DRAFT_441126 [Aspergillus ellipticus CBS 707.79]|uniref:Uncharacterized protein n=1 Tax=Aspergillus ellipticus CBS 707.79 TaxID=1448320 RepID=A0A319DAZ9_9EURO|nr:hypothetical protein BO71DRAFT_441126 [Aspergillus ellipticus CBS 707.79]
MTRVEVARGPVFINGHRYCPPGRAQDRRRTRRAIARAQAENVDAQALRNRGVDSLTHEEAIQDLQNAMEEIDHLYRRVDGLRARISMGNGRGAGLGSASAAAAAAATAAAGADTAGANEGEDDEEGAQGEGSRD